MRFCTTTRPPSFKSCAPTRYLHSFPTRRSSDLSNNFLLDGLDNNQVSDNLLGYTPAPDAIQEFNLITQKDRKSTRLNSSHQIISYAVFCLKKTTSTLLRPRPRRRREHNRKTCGA